MARMIRRRFSNTPGTCPVGCWTERQPNGSLLCVCGDTLLKGPFDVVTNLPTGVKVAASLVVGAAIGYFGGGYLATRR